MSISTTRVKEDQNLWNFLLSGLFLLVLIAALLHMWRTYGTFPQTVSVFDAVLMSFAAFRITRLVVYDKITRWFRELFVKKELFEKDGTQWVKLVPYEKGLMGTIHDLLGCPWCISFWSAIIIAFSYFMFSWAWFVIFFLALAGAGSLIQIIANAIGWRAENHKLDSHDKEQRMHSTIDITSIGN